MTLSRLARYGLSGLLGAPARPPSRCLLLGAPARPLGSLSCRRRPGLVPAWTGPASLLSRGHQTVRAAPLPGASCQVSAFPGASCQVSALGARDEERLLEVVWEDGERSLYPYTWLRDNCQCPACTLQSAQARSLLFSQLDIHTGVQEVQLHEDNQVGCGSPPPSVSMT